jgi:peptide/nickel transport system substrate-binding protein
MKTRLFKPIIFILLGLMLMITLLTSACGTTTSTTNTTTTSPPTNAAAAPTPSSPLENTPTQAMTSKYGGTLRLACLASPPPIGWPAGLVMGGGSLVQSCLETLLRGDNKGGVYPWLAESYKIADDLRSITFTLRKGIKFHDGSDLNAEVVKWNLDNMINAHKEPYWSSVDIIDGNTVRVNFKQWINSLPSSFADVTTTAYIISKAAYDKNGLAWVKMNPVGTGPFKFVSFQQDVGFKVSRNSEYWKKDAQGNQLPYMDGIEYIFVADYLTQKSMMQTGEADIVNSIDVGKQSSDMSALGLTVKYAMNTTTVLIGDTVNESSPWSKKEVREAAEYAIDREAIAKSFGYGFWQTVYQIPPRNTTAYDPNFSLGRKYDVNKAKQLLAQAGYPDGFKTIISAGPISLNRDVLVAVQSYLAKVGIQADLDFVGSKWMTYMYPGTFPNNTAVIMALPSFDPSFSGGLQFMTQSIGKNWARTPELTQAIDSVLASPAADPNLVRIATNMITKDALLIPINEGGAAWATQPYGNAHLLERGDVPIWDTETAWLNK